ncbi:MAG TPA: 30S ribosomal protein S5 [Candidatus Paceibacterota bacterium]
MNDIEIKKEKETTGAVATEPIKVVAAEPIKRVEYRERKKNPRRQGGRPERVKPEFDQKIISIRRVTRVAAGGRRFSFSVALVAGDRKGRVGVGTGKAGDTSIAIDKALKNAKKNMIRVTTTPDFSIPHRVAAKYSSAIVQIFPARGKGLVAGSSVRNVLELAGVKDVNAKVLSGSKNRLNIARVAIKALSMLRIKKQEAQTPKHDLPAGRQE